MSPDAVSAPADVVVGFATCDPGAASAADVVHAVASAFDAQRAAVRWAVILSGTETEQDSVCRIRDAIAGSSTAIEVQYRHQPSDSLNLPYHGLAGRARALRVILAEARARQARGCVVLDPRGGLPAGGLDHLVQPLVSDAADLVAPAYSRHLFTGALVHGVIYPVFRALYGVQLRYPVFSDFALSAPLIDAVLPEPVWETESGQLGIDLWLAATAVTDGFRVAQASLGPRIEERAPLDLSSTFAQVVGFLFSDMERRAPVWQRIRGSRPLPSIGRPLPVPDQPDVDAPALAESFRLASRELQEVWAEVLPPLAILQWRRLALQPAESFHVDDALWARTLYDFAMGHRLRVIPRDALLRSMTPLYLGWLASFVLEVRHLPPAEAEVRLDQLCLAFENEKPYLISQWRWPERFRPVKLRR